MSKMPQAKKSLGQHWLNDQAALDAVVQAAEIGPDDTVLEIGPGTGSLTKLLTEKAGGVIAVEFDTTLARQLASSMQIAKNLQIIEGSILEYDLTQLPPGYKIAANIPYYLTAHLLRLLTETSSKPSICALLVQKEVAERIAASPGQMSLISAVAQLYYKVSTGAVVPAKLFTPVPKVDSQILILKRLEKPPFEVDEKTFIRIMKAGFSARRKTLLNSLSGGLRLGKGDTASLLSSAGIDPGRRPQELSLSDWHAVYLAAKTMK